MEVDLSVDAFYSNMENGAIGAFYGVTEGVGKLGLPDPAMQQSYDALHNGIANGMSLVEAVDGQLLTAAGSTRDSLVGVRRGLVLEIDSLHLEVLLLDSSLLVQRIAGADQLMALNASAVTVTVPEQFQQTVNGIYLNTLGKGNPVLTPLENSQLSAIANTCPYENGPAVRGARNLLEIINGPQVYNDSLLCTPPSESIVNAGAIAKQTTEALRLLPNPAKGHVEVRFPQLQHEGKMDIFGVHGSLERTIDIGPYTDRYTLDLSGLAPGMYLVRLEADGRKLTKKLSVVE